MGGPLAGRIYVNLLCTLLLSSHSVSQWYATPPVQQIRGGGGFWETINSPPHYLFFEGGDTQTLYNICPINGLTNGGFNNKQNRKQTFDLRAPSFAAADRLAFLWSASVRREGVAITCFTVNCVQTLSFECVASAKVL